jgi:NADH-quinone oxidoreductase subunit E
MTIKKEYPKETNFILLNVLKDAQEEEGYLSEKTMRKISEKYDIPLARLYGIATFYMMLKTKPQGKHVIEFCSSPSCILNDSITVEEALKKKLGIDSGETTKDKLFSLYRSSCIGCCDQAPAMLIDGKPYGKLTIKKIDEIIDKIKSKEKNIKKKNNIKKQNKK